MKKIVASLVFIITSGQILLAQSYLEIAKEDSKVGFTLSRLLAFQINGSFNKVSGSLTFSRADFSDAQFQFDIDAKSVRTNNSVRDRYIKSPGFLDVLKYPEISFKSTSFVNAWGKYYLLFGKFTIKGITKPARFKVIYMGAKKDKNGKTKMIFSAKTILNRFDYGLKWNLKSGGGMELPGKKVAIYAILEFQDGRDNIGRR
jgi:polyisoprenoid-binding protein YceI